MKKIVLAVAALALAIVGFGSLAAPQASAAPATVWVANANVAFANGVNNGATPPAPLATPWTATSVQPFLTSLTAIQTASGGQINMDTGNVGATYIVVQTNGSVSPMTLNGNGLVCTPACDNVATQVPSGASPVAVWQVTGIGSFVSGNVVTATQDAISVNSIALKSVGAVHNVALTVSKATVQAGAVSCAVAASQSSPVNGAATMTYTDIAGNALVGYAPTFKTASAATVAIGNTAGSLTTTSQQLTTQVQSDGKTIAAVDSYCGNSSGGPIAVSAAPTGPEDTTMAAPAGFSVSQNVTVTGVPANIALTASPAAIPCDGKTTSTVTAKVTDSAGNNVVDGTPVNFSVVALGTANPINTTTTGGTASSVITPLSGNTSGVVVTVSASTLGGLIGTAQSSILVACQPSLATATAAAGAPAPTATPVTGVTAPNTGTGGYLGQSSNAGFPLWTLVALALGSFVLVGGGIVVRRAK